VADVEPFRGLRYNVERVKDVSSVICPPYDIISPPEQRSCYQRSPYNIVRVELGEDCPSDSPQSNRYTRAADTLRDWLEEGVLLREPAPAFYVFQHRFTQQGYLRSRWGLAARVRLPDQPAAGARMHETTLESRVKDRLSLLRSCRVNVSPILGIVRQGRRQQGLASLLREVVGEEVDLGAVDHLGAIHHMWVVTDPPSIGKISAFCADKVLYIADGHHRYETAQAYQREQQAAHSHTTGDESFNFVMVTIADAGDPGVLALPAHRLLRGARAKRLADLREKLDSLFDLEYLEPEGATLTETVEWWLDALAERGKKGVVIGVYGLDGKRLRLLMPHDRAKLDKMLPQDRSQEWRNLDVAPLHWIILRRIMGVDTPQKEEKRLAYTENEREAISRVDSGEYQLAFLMNPIPVSSVLAVADAGDRMPSKSTYFYPKLPTGLVMYPLWDEEKRNSTRYSARRRAL
jgi:uncharacterized protein (DUF1015 family)